MCCGNGVERLTRLERRWHERGATSSRSGQRGSKPQERTAIDSRRHLRSISMSTHENEREIQFEREREKERNREFEPKLKSDYFN